MSHKAGGTTQTGDHACYIVFVVVIRAVSACYAVECSPAMVWLDMTGHAGIIVIIGCLINPSSNSIVLIVCAQPYDRIFMHHTTRDVSMFHAISSWSCDMFLQLRRWVVLVCSLAEVIMMAKAAAVAVSAPDQLWPDPSMLPAPPGPGGDDGPAMTGPHFVGLVYM